MRILVDWLPFVGFLMLYDITRGFADELGRPIHVTEPLDAEKWLFHGIVPTQWLQEHLYHPCTSSGTTCSSRSSTARTSSSCGSYAAVLYVARAGRAGGSGRGGS